MLPPAGEGRPGAKQAPVSRGMTAPLSSIKSCLSTNNADNVLLNTRTSAYPREYQPAHCPPPPANKAFAVCFGAMPTVIILECSSESSETTYWTNG